MPISNNIEFFTSEAMSAEASIGSILTMFANTEGLTGIGGLFTFDADATSFPLIRGPQIQEANVEVDRLQNITSHAVSSVVDINLTTTGLTTLYTVPSGNKFLILGVLLQAQTADTVTGDASASIGISPSTTDVFAEETLLGFNSATSTYQFWANLNKAVIANAGDVIRLDVTTGATATNLTATAYLIGLLI
jgi:hypothetical protein